MAEQVEMKAKVVQSEVKAVTARHKKALEERECELLWKVMDGACPPSPRSGPPPPTGVSSLNRTCETPDPGSDFRVLGTFPEFHWQKNSGVPGTLWVLPRQ